MTTCNLCGEVLLATDGRKTCKCSTACADSGTIIKPPSSYGPPVADSLTSELGRLKGLFEEHESLSLTSIDRLFEIVEELQKKNAILKTHYNQSADALVEEVNENQDLRSQLLAAQEENKKLETALRRLVNRLEEIHADKSYQSVWTINQIHVGPYTGPTYAKEFEAARAALSSTGKGEK